MGETGHHCSVSSCWTMQSPWSTCLTTTGLPDISGFSLWKLKCILFILGLKFGSSWLVITSELTIAGPCKTHGQHVLQQQSYQKYLRKSHTIHYNLYTNRICSMKKLKCILSLFWLKSERNWRNWRNISPRLCIVKLGALAREGSRRHYRKA